MSLVYLRLVSSRALALALGLAPFVLGCGGGGAGDAGASPDARVLDCAAPLSIALTPSTHAANAGFSTAGIAWSGSRCALYDDENQSDVVLAIADTRGTIFDQGFVASRGGRWVIAGTSTGDATPTTYIARLPTGTDITVDAQESDVRVSIVFRIEGEMLTLLDMRQP